MNVNILRRIINSVLPYLNFIDSVLRKTNISLSIRKMECIEPKIDHTFEYMYIELQNMDMSSSHSFTLKINEEGEVEATL